MINAVFTLQLVLFLAGVAFFLAWQRRFFVIDTRNIAENMTLQLLADYKGELYILNEQAVTTYVREKYVALCQELGLPLAATERITSLVWGAIRSGS